MSEIMVPTAPGNATSDAVLLASLQYFPATETGYPTTSPVFADLDATNLAITFVVPGSGAVIVRQEALTLPQTTGYLSWNLRDAAGNVANTPVRVAGGGAQQLRSLASRKVTGLTPEATVTWKWGQARSGSGTLQTYVGAADGEVGPAVMEVWSA